MKVKEVICEALRLVGRDDVADAISAGQALTDEKSRIKRAFLTYLNSVLDELARGYFRTAVRSSDKSAETAVYSGGKLLFYG